MASLQRIGADLEFLPPKADRARRTVGLPPAAVTLLRRHRKEQAERRLLFGEAWQNLDLVIERGDGPSGHRHVLADLGRARLLERRLRQAPPVRLPHHGQGRVHRILGRHEDSRTSLHSTIGPARKGRRSPRSGGVLAPPLMTGEPVDECSVGALSRDPRHAHNRAQEVVVRAQPCRLAWSLLDVSLAPSSPQESSP